MTPASLDPGTIGLDAMVVIFAILTIEYIAAVAIGLWLERH